MSEKAEYVVFARWVSDGASVLDLGCGDGELSAYLTRTRHVRAQGIELNEQAIVRCVAAGLSVYQQDIDTGLSEYGDGSFDYVILNQTLQQVKKPDLALCEALRVGKRAIVGFPNFAYWHVRGSILLRGRVPVTSALPFQWYDTPNLHFLSLQDFQTYCKNKHINVEDAFFVAKGKQVAVLPNLRAEFGFFLVSANKSWR